ncbi:MAG TPA: DUF2934 domain-containing protein [candidate division Zixibacteria bacterium]|nr:DUF2934 domain-containing protein [candidate division Zixibacteria bacterium]
MTQNDNGEYPPEATVGDQSLRGLPGVVEQEPLPSSPPRADLRPLIARLAYEIYLSRGKQHGHDLDDWLEAERIVLARFARSRSGDSGDGKEA